LVPAVQVSQEVRRLAVAFVKGQPIHGQAVTAGAVELFQGDLPLGPMVEVVGDACGLTAFAILIPNFGEEQVGIDEGLEASARNAQVDSDDAVFFLAAFAAPLPLDARSASAFLDDAGLVDDADGAEVVGGVVGEVSGDVLLVRRARLLEGPDVVFEELLESADSDACLQGQGFAGFAFQIRLAFCKVRIS
jgi:hypothetical protein